MRFIRPRGEREANVECSTRMVPPARRCLIGIVASCRELRLRCFVFFVTRMRLGSILRFLTSAGLFDCSRGCRRRWLPDYSGRKTEECSNRPRGEPGRGFAEDRAAAHTIAQDHSGDTTGRSPFPPQGSRRKRPCLRERLERVAFFDLPLHNERGSNARTRRTFQTRRADNA